MRADAESSCTESRTDFWSLDAARNPWLAPTTELWAPTPVAVDPDGKRTSTRAVLLAVAGQNCWPPAGSYMAATGQDLMAADRRFWDGTGTSSRRYRSEPANRSPHGRLGASMGMGCRAPSSDVTLDHVATSGDPDGGWMVVAASDANGAPGSWRWNVKRHRQDRWETVVSSDRACLSCGDAVQAAEDFMSRRTDLGSLRPRQRLLTPRVLGSQTSNRDRARS